MTQTISKLEVGESAMHVPRLAVAPPAGMRDLLPPASHARESLTRCVGAEFSKFGYEPVVTPPFEHAEVLERGLNIDDRRDLLRFVEPETGEVALLRPDITPQVARLVATHFRERPRPWRICYEGTIVRRRQGRARRHRQISQAGIECIGWSEVDADAEVIEVAYRACRAAGLAEVRIELGEARLVREAVAKLPAALHHAATEALSRKDQVGLQAVFASHSLSARDKKLLHALPELYGGTEMLRQARKLRVSTAVDKSLDRLQALIDKLEGRGLDRALQLDLGEPRGMRYYTGARFVLLADGPGEPIGSGGRYDELVGRFGEPAPATGCALHLDNLEWALRASNASMKAPLPLRIAMAGHASESKMSVALRERGATVAFVAAANLNAATSYARGWGFDLAVLADKGGKCRALRLRDEGSKTFRGPEAADELLSWARSEETS